MKKLNIFRRLLRKLRSRREQALIDLVGHAWAHSGYPDCGYRQMTTEQRKLYKRAIEEYSEDV